MVGDAFYRYGRQFLRKSGWGMKLEISVRELRPYRCVLNVIWWRIFLNLDSRIVIFGYCETRLSKYATPIEL